LRSSQNLIWLLQNWSVPIPGQPLLNGVTYGIILAPLMLPHAHTLLRSFFVQRSSLSRLETTGLIGNAPLLTTTHALTRHPLVVSKPSSSRRPPWNRKSIACRNLLTLRKLRLRLLSQMLARRRTNTQEKPQTRYAACACGIVQNLHYW